MAKVLIACEESQRVCTAFRELGHEAYSCDIQEPSGGHPEWHILGDVLQVLDPDDWDGGNGRMYHGILFTTMSGEQVFIDGRWDLIIAHPPCTYLSNAGAARLYKRIEGKTYIERERFEKGIEGKNFFMKLYSADCERLCIENPVPSGVYHLPKYTQVVQPYEFGHPYSKKTCLWLRNLPKLKATNVVTPEMSWVSGGSKKRTARQEKTAGQGIETARQGLKLLRV